MIMEKILKIDVDDEGYNKSRCPHNSEIMLGGLTCKYFCKFFKSFDYDNREVVCTFHMEPMKVNRVKRPVCNWLDDNK